MKHPVVIALFTALLAGAAGLGVRALAAPGAPHVQRVGSAASVAPAARTTRASRAGVRRAAAARAAFAALPSYIPRDPVEVRARIAENEAGTYIGEMLAERDSSLARWPDRTGNPLRVWVQSADSLAGWKNAYADEVRLAFLEWTASGAPVPFTFVNDSAAADVHVAWIDHFAEPISGKTLWARDDQWWIVGADIVIALRHRTASQPASAARAGVALDASAVHAIALHEVGHLLGLDHTADRSNIMTPRVRVRSLSPADLATMRLLYSLPPGRVR